MLRLKKNREMPYMAIEMLPLIFIFPVALYFFADFRFSLREWVVLSIMVILWCVAGLWGRRHYSGYSNMLRLRISNHIKVYTSLIVLEVLILLFLPVPVILLKKVITITFGIFALDLLINFLVIQILNNDHESQKYVLIAGTGDKARIVENQVLTSHRIGYRLKGFINCNNHEQCLIERDKVLGDLNNINQYLQSNAIDEIVIALPDSHKREIQEVMSVADYHGIRTKYVLDYHEIFGTNYKITRFGQIDTVNIRQLPVDEKHAIFLRNCFDKLFASVALTLLLPLFLVIAAIIKMESKGPVFYCPIRIGKGGKPFKLFKFRSMKENDDTAGGVLSTSSNDPRITRVGRILRKYSLDELPQFINVFVGSMSVVGPRPHRRFLNRQLQESVYKYMIRHYVKPGITGWAQVNGWRGPTDTEEQKKQRTLHDLWYVENWSFRLDIKIIFLTIFGAKARRWAF